jgi:predicted dehydrogenase
MSRAVSHATKPIEAVPGRVRIGVIGAGNYASTMLIPHLAEDERVQLKAVATTTALSSASAQSKFGFDDATTDYRNLIEDDQLDAIVIATRHDTHARIAADALRHGKAVFVEKPLAINEGQLADVASAVKESGNDRIQVGFNRRFAPLLRDARQRFGSPQGPSSVVYEVRAGSLATDSWYKDVELHGSRFIGEGCHFIDTASWWIGADPVDIVATSSPDDLDNLICTLRYPDGSTATIMYFTTRAPRRFPKETLTVHAAQRTARITNFSQSSIWSSGRRRWRRSVAGVDKGQAAQLVSFVDSVRKGDPLAIPFESEVLTTRATFLAHDSALRGTRLDIAPLVMGDQ